MRGKRTRCLILIADSLAIPLAWFIAYWLRYGDRLWDRLVKPSPLPPVLIIACAFCAWRLLNELMPLDGFRDGWTLPATVSTVVLGVTMQMGATLAVAYLARIYLSRLALMYFVALFCCLTLMIRAVALLVLRSRRQAGKIARTVIVGDGRAASELARRIKLHPELPYEIVGFLKLSTTPGGVVETYRATGTVELSSIEVLSFLNQQRISELIVCVDLSPSLEMQNLLIRCRGMGIRVNLLPRAYELYSTKATLLDIDGVPLISLEDPRDFRTAPIVKRTVDLTLGSLLLVASVPILAIAGTLLWAQKRHVFHRELRCGLNGRTFWMYRLNVDRKNPDAPALDRFLDRLSISELPQLLNVLAGQMSLVGPRPESPDRVRDYSEWQRRRLRIKPGMTGLAQVNGLREHNSSEEKARFDLQYTLRWTPIIDLVLLLQTLWTLIARSWHRTQHPRQDFPQQEEPHTALARTSPE